MRFSPPLKVFLSYSHRDNDDRDLFREFRNHLTGLEDDRLIRVWWDKEITAGTRWNDEIKARLAESQIFLPLTSASFNASKYIREEELPRAWAKYDAGECMITPVMWRRWDPPQKSRWSEVQFLYGPDRAVCSAQNDQKDDVLRVIAETLRHSIAGTRPRTAEPDPASPIRIPHELPYLCDWTSLCANLEKLYRKSNPKPAVLLLAGTFADCAEQFLRRVHPKELRKRLQVPDDAPAPDVEPVDWPSSASELTAYFKPYARSGKRGLLVWKTLTTGWDSTKDGLLRELISELADPAWELPEGLAILVVISVILRDRNPDAIARIVHEAADARIPLLAVHMPEIKRDDAIGWAFHQEVGRRFPGRNQLIAEGIDEYFNSRGGQAVQMGHLAPELINILRKCHGRAVA